MKILIVGAGALGGYFGARLIEAKESVTFLLRDRRIAQLHKANGLNVKSPFGDISLPIPSYVRSSEITDTFDLIIVSCKAYDLYESMESFAYAVGAHTMILPVLNGMQHIDILINRFGKEKIIGGSCQISAALDDEGNIMHLNQRHAFTFGELDGKDSTRIKSIEEAFSKANFQSIYSQQVMLVMWEKWILIATIAGSTCLMRAALCDIHESGGKEMILQLLKECIAIANYNGFPPREESLNDMETYLTDATQTTTASMLKDIEKSNPIEGEAIIGNFLEHAPPEDGNHFPLLTLIYIHLSAYNKRKKREA